MSVLDRGVTRPDEVKKLAILLQQAAEICGRIGLFNPKLSSYILRLLTAALAEVIKEEVR
jgi:hypothetical protein